MFLLRLGSFNALEQELRRSKRWESWVGCRKPSADTIGRVYSQMSLADARQLLVEINRISWRSKAIHLQPQESYRVVAIDGHELSASRARCCDRCSQRKIKVGEKTVLEYYHRVVVAQWVGVSPAAILDLELIAPQEGEVTAARRLLERILVHYPRLIDVITADALYLEAPFIRLTLNAGKHVVIVMKQENRELFRDADQLRAVTQPCVLHEGRRTTRLWDISQLSSFSTLGLAASLAPDIDDYLESICERLQLTPTKYKLAEKRYLAVAEWLNADGSLLAAFRPLIYPQGSFLIGTTVQPFRRQEFDLNFVCQLAVHWRLFSNPVDLLNLLEARIKDHELYRKMYERRNRCIALYLQR